MIEIIFFAVVFIEVILGFVSWFHFRDKYYAVLRNIDRKSGRTLIWWGVFLLWFLGNKFWNSRFDKKIKTLARKEGHSHKLHPVHPTHT